MNTSDRMKSLAPVVLRVGVALVFLWFGFQQLVNTSAWVGLIPEFVTDISGVSASTLVVFNGAFEIVFGLCLLVGFYTRIAALLLALHMLHITFVVGYNATGVRDFGLSVAAIAVFLFGPHAWTVDRCLLTRNTQNTTQNDVQS